MREQIAGILALVEDAVIGQLGEANQATKSSTDTKEISLMHIMASSSLGNDFRSAANYFVVEQAVQKCVLNHPSVDAAAAKLIDVPYLTIHMATFIKLEFEKISVDKARFKKRFPKLAKAVEKKKFKVEDGTSTIRINTARYSSTPTVISYYKVTIPKA